MPKEITNKSINRIAFIGNYIPRQCGIATFTTDLSEAIALEFPKTTCIALPVNDVEEGYDYPSRVRFEFTEKDIESYLRASDFLNINNVDIVSLQFEYGIFGGKAGSHIIALLRELRMPIVTTLHTILRDPNPEQRLVLDKVASLSDRLVVMSKRGAEFLRDVYNIPAAKIDLIHHGIPDVPFVDPSFHKDLFGVEGKIVLLSFGLLSPNKGIETVISALPKILERYPNVVYIVLGETHPHVKRHEGETYRLSLQWLAQEKNVESQVIFYNRFVSLDELVRFIGATDIYITPYLNKAQITSGTLAYTLGAGKAVISTPYWYAEEMLADERGVLVPFKDPDSLSDQVIRLLDDEQSRHAMRKRAYMFGRDMIWSKVAEHYMESFQRARTERMHTTKLPVRIVKPLDERPGELPPLKLDHLLRMTDDTGMLQHAIFTIPNFNEGYSIDDNARALIVSVLMEAIFDGEATKLASGYLAFILYAFNSENQHFRNFLNYRREWLESSGSDDSHGRTIWALGTVLGRSKTPSFQSIAGRLFEQSLPAIVKMKSPRAWSFALMGIHEYSFRFAGDSKVSHVRLELAERLLTLYKKNRTDDWRWFENSLSYCNAALPHALMICGNSIPNAEMTEFGIEALSWLAALQKSDSVGGHFISIGSNGFYTKNGVRARFDQQPVEAQTMVSACLEAYRITGDGKWRKEARRAFEWFLGRNDLNLSIYDPISGGCRDGLHSDRLNENQGAESTLAFLQALLELRLTETTILSLETEIK
ncbi:MAG: glycosyl transferase family 1 [Ignavibacteria bacterium]|nr:glycosyl transferase family 1 [Ignavibacteria bacterium]